MTGAAILDEGIPAKSGCQDYALCFITLIGFPQFFGIFSTVQIIHVPWTTVCCLNGRSFLHTFCSIEIVKMPSWVSWCCQRHGQTERPTEVMRAKLVSLMSARFQRAAVVDGGRGFSAAFRDGRIKKVSLWLSGLFACVFVCVSVHIQIPRPGPGSQIRKGQFAFVITHTHHMVLTWSNPQLAEQGGDVYAPL